MTHTHSHTRFYGEIYNLYFIYTHTIYIDIIYIYIYIYIYTHTQTFKEKSYNLPSEKLFRRSSHETEKRWELPG